MHVLPPTSRTGKRVYLSLWDLFWALLSPVLALYLRDASILSTSTDWTVVIYYWVMCSGFALLAFFALRIQDGLTHYFSVHEALDIAEAVLLAELLTFGAMFTLTRLDGIPRSMPLIHGIVLLVGIIAARLAIRIVYSEPPEPQDYRTRRERFILIPLQHLKRRHELISDNRKNRIGKTDPKGFQLHPALHVAYSAKRDQLIIVVGWIACC